MEFEKLVDEVLKELLKRLQLYHLCDSHPPDQEIPVNNKVTTKELDFSNKKLLTEQMLEEFSLKYISNILVSNKCIITPLAMDYIRDRGITVKNIN